MRLARTNTYNQAARLGKVPEKQDVQVIAITAGKGGVGKSNVSVNLASALSKLNKRVMLLDADLGLANVDVLLGLHPKYNLSDVLAGQCELRDIILESDAGYQIIPASSGVQKMAQLDNLENAGLIAAFNDLADDVDVLLVDTAAGLSDNVISYVKACQEVMVVVCDEPTSITDAYALIKVLNRDHQVQRFHIVANMVQSKFEGRELYTKLQRVTSQYLNCSLEYMGAISYDEYLKKSVKQQKTVIEAYPSSRASEDFSKLAKKVCDMQCQNNVSSHTTFFLENILKQSQLQ